MNIRAVLGWLMLLVAVVAGYIIWKTVQWRQAEKFRLSVPQHSQVDYAKIAKERNLGAKEFVLKDQDDQLFFSNTLRGKVWVLSFFYSTCTTECHQLNSALAKLMQELPYADVEFVSISCNPEIDSPEVLKQYASRFPADRSRWHVLTGNFDYIKETIADPLDNFITYKKGDHSRRIIIYDRQGRMRDIPSDATNPEIMAQVKAKILELRDEPESGPLPTKPNPSTDEDYDDSESK